jgi:hypothetical protein
MRWLVLLFPLLLGAGTSCNVGEFKVLAVNEYQEQAEVFFKVVVRLCIAWWVLGLLRFLPDDVAKKLLGMFGL